MPQFTIGAKITELYVDLEIRADSLEDALEKGKKLKIPEFIDFKGSWIDGEEIKITGVHEND